MCLVIREAESEKEKRELDKLLWKVLWEPLGFSPDIRKKFKLDDPRIELIAINSETKEIIGGLVANWISDETMEIRHIAVRSGCRGTSVGRKLVDKLVEMARKESIADIQTHARNTSIGFFYRLGFESTGKRLQHQDFSMHGITFQIVQMRITKE